MERDVTKRFGGLTAVDSVSLTLEPDTSSGLIGPNGSGKTTLLSILAGTHAPSTAPCRWRAGRSRAGARGTACAPGSARTFQTTRLFSTWTLRECMRLAEGERDRRRAVERFSPGRDHPPARPRRRPRPPVRDRSPAAASGWR